MEMLLLYIPLPRVPRSHACKPRRHFAYFFDITGEEREAVFELLSRCRHFLTIDKPHGYNIGINCGEAAGQTTFHLHVHLVPRYPRDIDNPRGGVRDVILSGSSPTYASLGIRLMKR